MRIGLNSGAVTAGGPPASCASIRSMRCSTADSSSLAAGSSIRAHITSSRSRGEVVPLEELDAAVERQALTLAKLPAATVEYNKKLINMSYELMGVRQVVERSMELEAIALASTDSSPEIEEFDKIREKDGLKAALSWNADRFAEEDAWFKKSRERG